MAPVLSAEGEIERLEALLNDNDFQMNRFAEVPATAEALEKAKARVAVLYDRWQELEAIQATAK